MDLPLLPMLLQISAEIIMSASVFIAMPTAEAGFSYSPYHLLKGKAK
jgi:hypothetical protein